MNEDEIERAMRGLRRARASRELGERMGALFEGAALAHGAQHVAFGDDAHNGALVDHNHRGCLHVQHA